MANRNNEPHYVRYAIAPAQMQGVRHYAVHAWDAEGKRTLVNRYEKLDYARRDYPDAEVLSQPIYEPHGGEYGE